SWTPKNGTTTFRSILAIIKQRRRLATVCGWPRDHPRMESSRRWRAFRPSTTFWRYSGTRSVRRSATRPRDGYLKAWWRRRGVQNPGRVRLLTAAKRSEVVCLIYLRALGGDFAVLFLFFLALGQEVIELFKQLDQPVMILFA